MCSIYIWIRENVLFYPCIQCILQVLQQFLQQLHLSHKHILHLPVEHSFRTSVILSISGIRNASRIFLRIHTCRSLAILIMVLTEISETLNYAYLDANVFIWDS
jgi:hypothetical protein